MVVLPLAIDRNKAVIGGAVWLAVEGESIHNITWPLLDGNANNCGMTFKDNFTSNVAINNDIVLMQYMLRSKARAEAELIAEVSRDLGLDVLDLSMNLECWY